VGGKGRARRSPRAAQPTAKSMRFSFWLRQSWYLNLLTRLRCRKDVHCAAAPDKKRRRDDFPNYLVKLLYNFMQV